jgi:hypothetical protein
VKDTYTHHAVTSAELQKQRFTPNMFPILEAVGWALKRLHGPNGNYMAGRDGLYSEQRSIAGLAVELTTSPQCQAAMFNRHAEYEMNG